MPDLAEITELASELKRGRAAAWERLYALTHLPLLRLLRRLLRDDARAEEALQATYLAAIERIASFDAMKGCVDAWLVGIARNKAREVMRVRGLAAGGARIVAVEAAPSRNGAGGEAELVAVALDRLEPRYAEVLRRKYLAGESVETIAGALGLKTATVGTLLHRGRERFREMYLRLESEAEARHD